MAPTIQKAIVVQQDGSVALREIAVPKPGPDEILVKIVAAAQNPTDWKTAQYGKRAGSVSGCDFSGIVEEIGPNVPPGLRLIGERVAGDPPVRRVFRYLVAYADFVVHVPDTWSFEDAAQLGIAPLTALRTLCELLELPEPTGAKPPQVRRAAATTTTTAAALIHSSTQTPVLISGGASSVGQYAVQLAKLSGAAELCLVRSLGADVVVDYRDPAAAAKQIRDAAPTTIAHAVDCVSAGTSLEIVAAALGGGAGRGTIGNLTLGDYPHVEGVRVLSSVVFEFIGKVRCVPLTAAGRRWIRLLSELLGKGALRPSPVLVQPHGLASVAQGLQYMREGKVSAQKIVYRIADTPKE
ncbi:chaperonin 10-like protein [Russula brevipes]|nr:chaperonin 10-like protein [Russula brevipes]